MRFFGCQEVAFVVITPAIPETIVDIPMRNGATGFLTSGRLPSAFSFTWRGRFPRSAARVPGIRVHWVRVAKTRTRLVTTPITPSYKDVADILGPATRMVVPPIAARVPTHQRATSATAASCAANFSLCPSGHPLHVPEATVTDQIDSTNADGGVHAPKARVVSHLTVRESLVTLVRARPSTMNHLPAKSRARCRRIVKRNSPMPEPPQSTSALSSRGLRHVQRLTDQYGLDREEQEHV